MNFLRCRNIKTGDEFEGTFKEIAYKIGVKTKTVKNAYYGGWHVCGIYEITFAHETRYRLLDENDDIVVEGSAKEIAIALGCNPTDIYHMFTNQSRSKKGYFVERIDN